MTIRVDHDVVEWLKKRQRLPDPYNDILRSYVNVQTEKNADRRT